MIRLSEVILDEAEAYNALGDLDNATIHLGAGSKTGPAFPVNFGCKKIQPKTPQENMLESILDERMLNLSAKPSGGTIWSGPTA